MTKNANSYERKKNLLISAVDIIRFYDVICFVFVFIEK